MTDETPIPAFLGDTLRTMEFRRRAGEWEVVPGRDAVGLRSGRLVEAFLGCFGWASLDSLRIHTADGVREVSDLSPPFPDPGDDVGFEADLALRLYWAGPNGELGRSTLPDAGRIQFDRGSNVLTLTVWPNLFTDTIDLYERQGETFTATRLPWAAPAQRNRNELAAALRCLASSLNGEVVSADSELVDGVGTGGFAESAAPL